MASVEEELASVEALLKKYA